MKIAELISKLDYHFNTLAGEVITDPDRARALRSVEISEIVNDSRRITENCLFFCIVGAVRDGHEFARQALLDGAAALVVQKDLDLSDLIGKTPVKDPVIIRVQDTRYAMAYIAAAYYGNPASEMKIIGVTGTKGKTTTTYMDKSILEAAGLKVGLIGTIEILYGDVKIPANNTTPESTVLQKTFRDMADAGMQAVVMEVSSQALMMHRTQGFLFDIGIFTNLSPDHIGPNEHKDFDDYLNCKSLLFRQCKVGIFNADDPYYKRVCDGHTCSVETYGLTPSADLYAKDLTLIKEPGELGVSFDVDGLMQFRAEVPAPGRFSVYNALCAIAVCRHFGVTTEEIQKALLQVHVRGRIEMVKVSDKFTLLIDYAHNAMALESLLTTLREYQPHRLVCLFGCGGNRSKLRRFEMGEVSGKLAELSIITSDNPRNEEPMAIIGDIVTGISRTNGKYVTIPDRKDAIRFAIRNGEPGDIVVLAGKGHEDYQEIKGHKYPMDERVLIREILEEA
jgi:UDP-N-acetylmuramoyl-L-alanyl-D-glutamate--2,6-diaminopimelate ligase